MGCNESMQWINSTKNLNTRWVEMGMWTSDIKFQKCEWIKITNKNKQHLIFTRAAQTLLVYEEEFLSLKLVYLVCLLDDGTRQFSI